MNCVLEVLLLHWLKKEASALCHCVGFNKWKGWRWSWKLWGIVESTRPCMWTGPRCGPRDRMHFSFVFFSILLIFLTFSFPCFFSLSLVSFLAFFYLFFFSPDVSIFFPACLVLSLLILINLLFFCSPWESTGLLSLSRSIFKRVFSRSAAQCFYRLPSFVRGWHGSLLSFF